jgi:hypothetical protein
VLACTALHRTALCGHRVRPGGSAPLQDRSSSVGNGWTWFRVLLDVTLRCPVQCSSERRTGRNVEEVIVMLENKKSEPSVSDPDSDENSSEESVEPSWVAT